MSEQDRRPALNRRAGRVLLLDPSGRVLLVRTRDPARPEEKFWVLPGGGTEDGETPRQAACRELREEVGVETLEQELEGPIHDSHDEWSWAGRLIRQHNVFFSVRLDESSSRSVSLVPAPELADAEVLEEFRWYGVEELESSPETFYPEILPRLLADRR